MTKSSSVQELLSKSNANQLLLGGQMLGISCIEELVELPDFLGVGLLHLGGNFISDEGVARLVTSPNVGSVEDLDVSQNNLSVRAAKAIARSSNLKKLVKLNLCNNYLGDRGVYALMQAYSLPSLWTRFLLWLLPPQKRELFRAVTTDPYRSPYREIGFQEMAEAEPRNPVWPLLMKGERFAALSTNALPALQWLDLSWNQITDEGARQLVRSPLSCQFTYLNLQNNSLSSQGVEALIDCPFIDDSLIINVSGNPISAFEKERLQKKAGDRLRI